MASKAHTRRLIAAAAFLVLAALIAWLFIPRPVEVDAETVVSGLLVESVADEGTTRVRDAYVVAAPVAGRVERLELEVGDRVQAGRTLVARLRPSLSDPLDPRSRARAEAVVAAANAAVAGADAQSARLRAEARRTGSELARLRPLADQGFTSRQSLETAETSARVAEMAYRAAQAEARVRRAELAAARAALLGPNGPASEPVTVVAPATGYVTRVLQESERTVAAGAPLVEIGDSGGLEAVVEFLSQDAVRIREGMAAEVYDWGGPNPLPAMVRRVEPQGFTKVSALGVEEQRVLVRLQFTGPPPASLGPAYRLWGRVVLRREPHALKAPLGALVRSGGGWAAYRIEAGRARLRPVKVGALTDREAEILGGLAAGDQLVVFPSDRVRDGGAVKVRTAARGR